MSEFNIIDKYFKPISGGELGLNDDAAIIDIPQGDKLVTSCDTIIESIHFIGNETPQEIAKKALRVNLSDMAAMGTKPVCYMVALSMPKKISEDWVENFAKGLAEDNQLYNIYLTGGDTTAGVDKLTISITIFGISKNPLTRGGAKAGDDIYVTGYIGDGYIGLKELQGERVGVDFDNKEYYINRYKLPTPRIDISSAIVDMATSAIDISDGLVQDVEHILTQSKVGADIYLNKIPVKEAMDSANNSNGELNGYIIDLITSGDDYELCFTASSDDRDEISDIANKFSIPISRVGVITDSDKLNILDIDGNEVEVSKKGYQHL